MTDSLEIRLANGNIASSWTATNAAATWIQKYSIPYTALGKSSPDDVRLLAACFQVQWTSRTDGVPQGSSTEVQNVYQIRTVRRVTSDLTTFAGLKNCIPFNTGFPFTSSGVNLTQFDTLSCMNFSVSTNTYSSSVGYRNTAAIPLMGNLNILGLGAYNQYAGQNSLHNYESSSTIYCYSVTPNTTYDNYVTNNTGKLFNCIFAVKN
jgi:hypothetical protein